MALINLVANGWTGVRDIEPLSEVSQDNNDSRGLIYTCCYYVSTELNICNAEMAFGILHGAGSSRLPPANRVADHRQDTHPGKNQREGNRIAMAPQTPLFKLH